MLAATQEAWQRFKAAALEAVDRYMEGARHE